jgi:hypothetical protein
MRSWSGITAFSAKRPTLPFQPMSPRRERSSCFCRRRRLDVERVGRRVGLVQLGLVLGPDALLQLLHVRIGEGVVVRVRRHLLAREVRHEAHRPARLGARWSRRSRRPWRPSRASGAASEAAKPWSGTGAFCGGLVPPNPESGWLMGSAMVVPTVVAERTACSFVLGSVPYLLTVASQWEAGQHRRAQAVAPRVFLLRVARAVREEHLRLVRRRPWPCRQTAARPRPCLNCSTSPVWYATSIITAFCCGQHAVPQPGLVLRPS